MAITAPVLVNGTWYNTANLSQYDTNAGTNTYTVQLVAGRRYYLVVESSSSGAAEAISSVVHDPTGTPLAFSRVSDGTFSARITGYGATTGNTIDVWECNVASTTATALIRITYPAAQTACGAGLFYLTGEDDTNTSVQVKLLTGTGTLPGVTMSSYSATANLALLVVATDSPTNTITATESRTKLYENDETERNNHAVFYQNPHGSDVTLNASITSDSWAAIGIEVRAGGSGPVGVSATDSAAVTDTRSGFTATWQTVEAATVTDTLAARADVTRADNATFAEALTALTSAVAATEAATLSEALTALTQTASAADTSTLTEAPATETVDVVARDAFAVAEAQAVGAGGGSPTTVTDTDPATVAEALTALQLAVTAVADVLTVTDVGAAHFDIVASDSLVVTEAIATIPLAAVVSEAATLSEALGWTVAWGAVELVTVGEAASAVIPGTFEGEPTMGAVAVGPRILGGP